MSRLRRRDNKPEIAVRRLLTAAGLRYRVAYRIPGQRRRTMDIAVPRRKLAVYIDGCFWHSCPEHLHLPKANADWWIRKMEMNRARDAASTAQLEALGWTVLRFWEHEPPADVAAAILDAARRRPEDSREQLSERVRALLDPDGGLRHARTRVHHHPGDELARFGPDGSHHAADPVGLFAPSSCPVLGANLARQASSWSAW
ncbi:very short patch repair endonuclease [Modestobacter sp. I12A-02662]|uniref:very short patch repair endonuclease n=1 Tax=Modestobacter sp. I12A-02662 TaxID=1730496 RepID=UPI0034DF69A0